ncbi:protein kinase domain-containing protein [Nesterenkonia sp. CF4.4]|uniref:serine/threonine-protein kinase n=1 Tax=Nesterenkonia sp. CF4.4 TaxID=3373079 RepID=UPI003EE61D46
MNGDITGRRSKRRAERAAPLERVRRTFDASLTRGWDPPSAPGITVERLLGAGGNALVWLVWWDSPEEPDWQLVDGCPPAAFALKVPRAQRAGQDVGETGGRALRRPLLETAAAELQALDMLRHEHLVRAYGALETSQGLGLMLEPYNAGSLGQLLRSVGRLSLGEVVTVLTPIATALGALHQGGVAHGDVSPGNILLAADGKPALGDLADAAILGTARSETGTPGFAAPERELEGRLPLRADSATRREARAGLAPEADVFSLGAVAWFALTGLLPARSRQRAPLPSLRPELPETIALLLESALQEDPALRPSAQHFAVELFRCAAPTALDLAPHVHEEVVPELPTRPGPETSGRRRAPRLSAFALAALGFLGLWFAAGVFTPTPTHTPTTTLTPVSQSTQPPVDPSEQPPEQRGPDDPRGADDRRPVAPDPADPSPAELLSHPDPERAVEGVAVLRTRALREASVEQVRGYTVADAPAWTADARLVGGFAEAGLSYRGAPLEITVDEEVDDEGRAEGEGDAEDGSEGDRRSGGEDEGERARVAELRATVTATGMESGVPESQQVVLVMQREDGRWRLHTVREVDPAAAGAAASAAERG